MSFCYFKKSHIGFFACFFSSWVNCCDLWGWTAVPSNPFCDGFLHIGCASPAASGSVNSCRHTSAKLPTNVDQLAHKCRPCCRHLSAIKTQRPHSIAGAGMRHGLYSGCPQQSLYALSRKGAKNAKATSNCRDLVGRIRAGPKGMFDRLPIYVRRPPSRVLRMHVFGAMPPSLRKGRWGRLPSYSVDSRNCPIPDVRFPKEA